MMHRTTLATLAVLSGLSACVGAPQSTSNAADRYTFVIVHGAFGGGWGFKPLDSRLTAGGHEVYRQTLTGLGERNHLATPGVDLNTHIEDVVNTIVFEDLQEVVLIGHSYGGMVLQGVADRIPDRIRCMIFTDAFLPENGESLLMASRGQKREAFVRGMIASARDGLIPPPTPGPKKAPQPLRTLTTPLVLSNPATSLIPGKYILTAEAGSKAEDDSFAPFAERARGRGWQVVVMIAGHKPVGSEWDELARLVCDLAE